MSCLHLWQVLTARSGFGSRNKLRVLVCLNEISWKLFAALCIGSSDISVLSEVGDKFFLVEKSIICFPSLNAHIRISSGKSGLNPEKHLISVSDYSKYWEITSYVVLLIDTVSPVVPHFHIKIPQTRKTRQTLEKPLFGKNNILLNFSVRNLCASADS